MGKKALLLLENGWFSFAEAFASKGTVFGEFVFNTSMTGYQEIITDPSYKGQIVVFTYPLIGNYGINSNDWQSSNINAEALIIRENSLIPSNYNSEFSLKEFLENHQTIGIEGIDTRALTRQIRRFGSLQGAISTEILDVAELKAKIIEQGSISDSNVFTSVINNSVEIISGNSQEDLNIAVIDFGIKDNIVENLKSFFNNIFIIPFDDNIQENLSNLKFDGILLSNGPGDPRIVNGSNEIIQNLVQQNIPITGICFGHQLIAKAFDLNIEKLTFGHHGGNHPVMNLKSGKVFITAQNHNYAVTNESLTNSDEWELTWKNLFDGSVEGMKHKSLPIECVQFHPEAAPGPNESNELIFKSFYELIKTRK